MLIGLFFMYYFIAFMSAPDCNVVNKRVFIVFNVHVFKSGHQARLVNIFPILLYIYSHNSHNV